MNVDMAASKMARKQLRRTIITTAPELSLEDLRDMNELMVSLINERMQQEAHGCLAALHIGSMVAFEHKGVRRVGEIIKIHDTSASIKVRPLDKNDVPEVWRVDAVLLSKTEKKSKDLPKKRRPVG